MRDKKTAVVIPLWKEKPSSFEEISFRQCCNILKNHVICLITHKKLKLTFYITILEQYKVRYKIIYFSEYFFDSIGGYNKLMLSAIFYIKFVLFKYILIFQLDCFVFRDELKKWSESKYSYIGAPWLEGYTLATQSSVVIGVGNGGFSLRNVMDHLRVIFFYKFTKNSFLKNFLGNEDIFWGQIACKNFSWFNIPRWEIAAQFSTEVQPRYFFLLHKKIPFGCHAWWKYDLLFWKYYIEEFGYSIELDVN